MPNILRDEATTEFRCQKCGKLLLKHAHGTDFEIKCNRCGTLNRLFEQMKEQVIITDPQGIILFVNNELENITGYSIDEVIGKKPSVWGGQMPKDFYEKMWKTLLGDKQGVQVKITNRKKSGELYKALLRISPVLDLRGEVKFLVEFESVVEN